VSLPPCLLIIVDQSYLAGSYFLPSPYKSVYVRPFLLAYHLLLSLASLLASSCFLLVIVLNQDWLSLDTPGFAVSQVVTNLSILSSSS
jgi:hypothetical protein